MTTDTKTPKKKTPKKAATTPAVTQEQIDVLTASCKNVDEKMEIMIQYIKTFNTFLCMNMISNNVDRSAEEGLMAVLLQLSDIPNPIND